MRLVLFLLFSLAFLSKQDVKGQVLGYGAQGTDGYGMQSVTSRIAKLPRDTAYHTLLPNELWSMQPWKDSVHSQADFQFGRIEYTDGSVHKTKWRMNYNYFLDNVDVELETGVVVGLARYSDLKTVYIGTHKYRYEPAIGFVEIVQDGTIEVAKKRVMRCLMENSSGFKHFPYHNEDPRGARSLETRYYWPTESYYILGPDGNNFRAGSLVLSQMVPHLKEKLRIFARINDTDFRKEEDILKIVEYANKHYSDPSIEIITLDESGSIENSSWRDRIYLLSSFEEPTVVMEDGSKMDSPTKLNYNRLTGWLHTVNRKGDTVLFTTATRYNSAMLDDVFIFNDRGEGPMEVLLHGKLGLARKSRLYDLGDKRYAFKDTYYFIVRNKAVEVNERMIVTLFPGHADEIEGYILNNDVNFGSRDEVMRLIAFCQQLQRT